MGQHPLLAPRARAAARVAIASACAFQVCVGITFLVARHQLGSIFSNSEDVQAAVARIAPICAVFQVRVSIGACRRIPHPPLMEPPMAPPPAQVTDAFQGVVGGVMRGVGKQPVVAGVNFVGFWLLGVPAAAVLTFALHVGLPGLWYGLNVGLFSVCAVFTLILSRIVWPAECARAAALSRA